MAVPPERNKAASAKPVTTDADLDTLPIQKTNPLVFVAVGVGVLVLGGVLAYVKLGGKSDEDAARNAAAAAASARIEAAEAKEKERERLEHLQLSAKAFAAAEEQDKAAAAAAAAASAAAAAEAEAKENAHTAGGAVAGGAPPPPRPKGPSASEVDELNKLGSSVNSELGGK